MKDEIKIHILDKPYTYEELEHMLDTYTEEDWEKFEAKINKQVKNFKKSK